VLASIVCSRPHEEKPIIVWQQREHVPLRHIASLEESAKAVLTALMTVGMLLDTKGRQALYTLDASARLSTTLVTVAAPWSYTVTKYISYELPEPFTIKTELLEELEATAAAEVQQELKQQESLSALGLTITSHSVLQRLVNGYHVLHPEGESASNITFAHVSSVIQEHLRTAVSELHVKLFADSTLSITSFMLILYTMMRRIAPHIVEQCLIDVTYEATELGIMRNGVLTYTTHVPYGSYALAREISAVTGVPQGEAYGYLCNEEPYGFLEHLPKKQRDEIEAMFAAYTDRVASAFKETGDTLAIPRHITLHADTKTLPLLSTLVQKAAERATGGDHAVTPATKNLQAGETHEFPLTIASLFFHTKDAWTGFKFNSHGIL
jgi:hypothetical protein